MRTKLECMLCLAERYFELSGSAKARATRRYYLKLNLIQREKISRAPTTRSLRPCGMTHRIVGTSLRKKYQADIKQAIAHWANLSDIARQIYRDTSAEYHKMLLSDKATKKQLDAMRLEVRRTRDLVAQRERRYREAKRKLRR